MRSLYLTTAVAVITTASFVANLFPVAAFVLAANGVRSRLRSMFDDVSGGLHDLLNELVAVAIARCERQAAFFKLATDRGHLPSPCTVGAGSEGSR